MLYSLDVIIMTTKKQKKENNDESEEFIYDEVDMGDKIKTLKNKLKKCEEERKMYLDSWQRDKADFVNARKNDSREKERFLLFAKKDLILQLLPVVDSFDMAMLDKDRWSNLDQNWRQGMEQIYNQFNKVLNENGVVEVVPEVGQEFDPALQEAFGVVEVEDEKNDGKVIEIMQKGYLLEQEVIRTAKVKVGQLK